MPIHSVTRSRIAEAYGRLCRRWVSPSVAGVAKRDRDARMAGSFFAMPLLLAAAMITSHVMIGEVAGVVSLAVGVLALPMIFCGALSLSKDSAVVGASALGVYGLAIAAIGAGASSANLLLWIMAAAIPLEAWFIYRSEKSIRLSGVAAAIVLAALLIVSIRGEIGVSLSPLTLLASFGYLATLLARTVKALAAHANAARRDDRIADLESAVEGVVLSLGTNGLILSLSAKAQDQFGIARNLLIGTPLLERVHVSDRVQYLAFLADMKGGAASATVELKLRCVAPGETLKHAHSVRFATYRLRAVPHSQGNGFVVVATDVSQAVSDRNALVIARREVETAEIAKSRFLASVSHELRTPLNSIIGFSDVLLQEICGKLPDSRQREYVELVHRSGNHLLSVVNAILDVSKIEAGTYPIFAESFAFKEAVTMVHDMLAHQASQKGVTLCDRVSPRIGNVVADSRAIHQVLINLVSNAVKFTESGGVVTIDALIEDDMLAFSVSDTGIGIAEADLKTLGQPFRQVQNDYTRNHEGTGLGLATVKGLVGLHGGDLRIRSTPGQGTVVDVRIPLDGPVVALVQEESANVVEFYATSDMKGGSHGEARKSA
ncbi:PAS domain-containing sensor histidine kinase [Phyllobacterium brassicacearum]|uniref:histidine kinase n=1 Tax=Phyllobacterium brassicacearum TaxID=314235 RepID=A0A2P7BVU6_9HYPH|nr:PAS domain-containing protein [Phyllobacterium brassicacearum]PSH70573.1 PAS domain-containing sensor histidine kinase [Phyllobacterium brassicacearum]TDQ35972.1 PAS/PAC sensor signal transduction histidine kinase [Phyllobacterium brassicacearum]